MIYFYIMLRISINSSPIRFLTSKCQNMCVCVCHVNCEMQSMAPNGSCHIMKLCYRIFFAVLRFFIAIDFPFKVPIETIDFPKLPALFRSMSRHPSAGRLGTTCNARCNSVLLDEHDGIHMIIYCMYVYIYSDGQTLRTSFGKIFSKPSQRGCSKYEVVITYPKPILRTFPSYT